jgi:LmbE family N-acetylglucosaminyl deacetylase
MSDTHPPAPDKANLFHSRSARDSSNVNAALVVAHPDDETLWAGGTILANPQWDWFIVALCRAHDPDRAPRFFRALEQLGAAGTIGDLDDGPDQIPLAQQEVQEKVLSLLGDRGFRLILTHGTRGEYTHHLRHEETSRAVATLWSEGRICADSLWLFAYEDGCKQYLPRAEKGAHVKNKVSNQLWQEKYRVITEIYGFEKESFEARTTPREEAFWCFDSPRVLQEWLSQEREWVE